MDDIAIVLHDLALLLPRLVCLLDDLGSVTGLVLNFQKCIVVWLCELPADIRTSIVRRLTLHHKGIGLFKFAFAAKYLGLFLGPGSDGHEWDHVLLGFKLVVQAMRNLCLGLVPSIRFYNLWCAPKLGYVGQLAPFSST